LSHDELLGFSEKNGDTLAQLAENARDGESRQYLLRIQDAVSLRLDGNAFKNSLSRENAKWDNIVESGATKLAIVRPKFDSPNEEKLVGQAAVNRMRAHLSLGTVLRIPLWHSGIWVTLKAPTELAFLELQRKMSQEKIQLGRQTQGLIYSNTSVYLNQMIADFAFLHITEATYRYSDVSELREVIKAPDISALIHGVACTMYPEGYPYAQPCFINPGKCQHTIEDSISLPRTAFTDTFRLTEKQRLHMTRKNAKFTDEELEAYQADFKLSPKRVVKLNDTVKMELKIPSLESYLNTGTEWIEEIVARSEKALGATVPKDAREDYMRQQMEFTQLCQYLHYIDKILMDEDDGKQITVEDKDTIKEILSTVVSHKEFTVNFYQGMQDFIDDSTITIFAIPKVPCPACSKEDVDKWKENEKDGKYPYLVPLDMIQLFFTLTGRRLIRIRQQAERLN